MLWRMSPRLAPPMPSWGTFNLVLPTRRRRNGSMSPPPCTPESLRNTWCRCARSSRIIPPTSDTAHRRTAPAVQQYYAHYEGLLPRWHASLHVVLVTVSGLLLGASLGRRNTGRSGNGLPRLSRKIIVP